MNEHLRNGIFEDRLREKNAEDMNKTVCLCEEIEWIYSCEDGRINYKGEYPENDEEENRWTGLNEDTEKRGMSKRLSL